MPYAFYERENNIHKYAVGLGNSSNHKILKISLGDSIKVKFLDLVTIKEEDLLKYNGNRIRLTYLPRLAQLFVKENLIILSVIFCAFLFGFFLIINWDYLEIFFLNDLKDNFYQTLFHSKAFHYFPFD